MRSLLVPIGLVALTALITYATVPPPAADAQDSTGADLFAANCAGCHQAGGEGLPGTFPPLAGNPNAAAADYVRTVITEGKTGTIEVDGVTYDSPMPAVSGLSDDQLDALVAHVVDLAGASEERDQPDQPDEPPPPVDAPTVGDVDRGHDLFVGSNRFDNGGGACASCHTAGEVGNLGGQSLGPDLTNVYQGLGGEPGLSAWLANPASDTMRPIFEDRPLSESEIADLVAFFADAPTQDRPNESSDWLLLAGLGGLVILIGGMAIAWRGMRQTYVETLRSKR
jgi:mono/diheme cytochrome c family protein